jgi:ATP:corrinoid adenosyltransferase
MFSSSTAAAGNMTRSLTKGYVVRFSEFMQYFRRLEGTSGRNALVESWSEHIRQHARLTEADRATEDTVRAFHLGKGPPLVPHFVAEHLPKSHEGRSHYVR